MTSSGAKRGPKPKALPETLDVLTAELVTEMRAAAEASRVSMRRAAIGAGYSHGTLQRLLAGQIYPISRSHMDAFVAGYGLDEELWLSRYFDYLRQHAAAARSPSTRTQADSSNQDRFLRGISRRGVLSGAIFALVSSLLAFYIMQLRYYPPAGADLDSALPLSVLVDQSDPQVIFAPRQPGVTLSPDSRSWIFMRAGCDAKDEIEADLAPLLKIRDLTDRPEDEAPSRVVLKFDIAVPATKSTPGSRARYAQVKFWGNGTLISVLNTSKLKDSSSATVPFLVDVTSVQKLRLRAVVEGEAEPGNCAQAVPVDLRNPTVSLVRGS